MKKLQITAVILAAACILAFAASSLVISSMAKKLDSQLAAERWSGDGSKVAQLSAFISPEARLSETTVENSLPSTLDREMVNASLEANEGARLYAYAYSTELSLRVSKADEYGRTVGSGVAVTATACGADFFLFHQPKLLSGQYISTDSVLNDHIVIDNTLAWQFFGSPDVVGRVLQVNGRDCYISGVTVDGTKSDYREFYGDKPRIYMSWSLAEQLGGEQYVTALEVVMPDPVSGFASDIFKKAVNVAEEKSILVENSARFTDAGLRALLGEYSSRGVRTKAVVYPYWENTTVRLADRAALVYIVKMAAVAVIALILLCELVLLYSKRKAIAGAVKGRISRMVRDRNMDRAAKKAEKAAKKAEKKKANIEP